MRKKPTVDLSWFACVLAQVRPIGIVVLGVVVSVLFVAALVWLQLPYFHCAKRSKGGSDDPKWRTS